MHKKNNLQKLVARLRELEGETLRLTDRDLAPSEIKERKIYEERLDRLDKSHSQSWFGDHSTTYYGNFQSPPGGHSFDVEWGFIPVFGGARLLG